MTEDKFIEIIKDVLNTDCGFKFISEMLEELGAFERGCNFNNIYIEYYNRGKRDKGLWLLDLVKKSHIEKYKQIEMNRR